MLDLLHKLREVKYVNYFLGSSKLLFFLVPSVRRHLFDHLLWSIFESSLHITNQAGPHPSASLSVGNLLYGTCHKPEGPGFCYFCISDNTFLSLKDWHVILTLRHTRRIRSTECNGAEFTEWKTDAYTLQATTAVPKLLVQNGFVMHLSQKPQNINF